MLLCFDQRQVDKNESASIFCKINIFGPLNFFPFCPFYNIYNFSFPKTLSILINCQVNISPEPYFHEILFKIKHLSSDWLIDCLSNSFQVWNDINIDPFILIQEKISHFFFIFITNWKKNNNRCRSTGCTKNLVSQSPVRNLVLFRK